MNPEKERLLAILKKQRELPHLYGQKLYQWQRDFLNSTAKKTFLTAANQIGKSTINIIKQYIMATDKKVWKKMWARPPKQFWYLYPTMDVATTEFHEKWAPHILANGSMKNDPIYGWEANFERKKIHSIRYRSGVTTYFKAYAQKASHLQSGTCDAIFCDEELPEHLYSELSARLLGTNGYYYQVFTATLSQEFWRQVMEERGKTGERFPEAFKQQISLFDCQEYEDGSPSAWTDERIAAAIAGCKSENEVKRRIYGRFVASDDLKYPEFSESENMCEVQTPPKDWLVYAGLDYGSGGKDGHPAAIVFVAVRPDFGRGEVFLSWRGDGVATTAGSIIERYVEMARPYGRRIMQVFYDHACKDMFTIGQDMGLTLTPANKSHAEGEPMLNTLFRSKGLYLQKTDENFLLAEELRSLTHSIDKRNAKDNLTDALRYTVIGIPWDFELMDIPVVKKIDKAMTEIDYRRAMFVDEGNEKIDTSYSEIFEEWNKLYDGELS